jgi:hypothetical protein
VRFERNGKRGAKMGISRPKRAKCAIGTAFHVIVTVTCDTRKAVLTGRTQG